MYPAYQELVPLIIQVTDGKGKAVADASVNISCVEDTQAVRNGFALTDEKGMTPSDPEKSAILITRRKLEATDEPDKPRELSFTYAATVQAQGFPEKSLTLKSGQEIARPLVVTLGK